MAHDTADKQLVGLTLEVGVAHANIDLVRTFFNIDAVSSRSCNICLVTTARKAAKGRLLSFRWSCHSSQLFGAVPLLSSLQHPNTLALSESDPRRKGHFFTGDFESRLATFHSQ